MTHKAFGGINCNFGYLQIRYDNSRKLFKHRKKTLRVSLLKAGIFLSAQVFIARSSVSTKEEKEGYIYIFHDTYMELYLYA